MPRRTPCEPHASIATIRTRTLSEAIDIEIVVAADLTPALVDPGQVESALLNLSLNARDAMPGGGRLTITCTNACFDAEFVAANPGAVVGDYVQLAVSDTGTGMSEEVLSRALDPFFTTKETGTGSGMGLPMVYGFAKQSGGYLRLESEPHQGTTVFLYLPRGESVDADSNGCASATVRMSEKGENILVLEDDESLRFIVTEMVESLHYGFVEAGTAAEARTILQGNGQIDLLLTDIVLPGGVSGAQLAEEIKVSHPHLPVVFMSGYLGDAQTSPAPEPLLKKPFELNELPVVLHAHLNATQGGVN